MLTQLATVKTRLGIAEDQVADDAVLTNFINLVSGRFERECNRTFGRSATAVDEFNAATRTILATRYPVESVTSFHLKSNETDGWVLQSSIDYLIRNGVVIELAVELGDWREQGKVTYAGGYVLPGATVGTGQTALPDEIEQCCIEEVARIYRDRDRLGLSGVNAEGGSISQLSGLELLKGTKEIVTKYERWNP